MPLTQEAASQVRARRWKGIVAAVVVGACISAAGIVLGLHMPRVLWAVVFAGPMAVTVPVLVWVRLVYWNAPAEKREHPYPEGVDAQPSSV